MVSASAMSFECPRCGYPRGLHTPDCPNAIHVAPMPTVQNVAPIQRRTVPTWLKVAGLLAIAGVVGWLAYRKLGIQRQTEIVEHRSVKLETPKIWRTSRPVRLPRYVDPDVADAALDQVMDADWLD